MTPTLPANRSLLTFSLRIAQKCPFPGSLYCAGFHKAISIQVNNALCTYSPHTFLPPLPHPSAPTPDTITLFLCCLYTYIYSRSNGVAVQRGQTSLFLLILGSVESSQGTIFSEAFGS